MADSWEDEDFEVVLPAAVTAAVATPPAPPSNWEDEEEEVAPAPIVSAPSAAQIEAARRRAELEEQTLQNKLKFELERDETPEQRRAREKAQVEAADHALSGELFSGIDGASEAVRAVSIGGSSSSGLGSVTLKTKQDHVNFGILCQKKLSNSTPLNISAFFKSVADKCKEDITTETLDEIIIMLTKVRDDKKKTEAKPKKVTKTKKELEAAKKKHDSIFGGSDHFDEYDHIARVAIWKWEIDEEVCGICRMPFETCCPGVKYPGDDCPPVWGQCKHAFHMQCVMKWLESQQNVRQECPMCRQPWKFRES